MKLKYEILWFEDNISWFSTLSMYIQEYLEENGFELITYRYENDFEGITEILNKHDYDLILMDYNLEGTSGDEIIEKIRNSELYTDIIFYSQNGARYIRQTISEKGIDGIFCSSRDTGEFEEKVNSIIRNTIKKVQDVNNMRGLVIAETIDLELKIEQIIKEYFKVDQGYVLDKKKNGLLQRILEKKIAQLGQLQNIVKKVESGNIELLIDEDILTVYNLYNGIQSILKEDIKEINNQLSAKIDEDTRIYLNDKKDSLLKLKEDLKTFDEDIIKTRNTLAHVQEKLNESGIPYLESLNREGTTIIFDNEKYIEIRKKLIKYSQHLFDVKEHFDSLNQEAHSSIE